MSATERAVEPLAVVGMACLLPGAGSPAEFWSGLLAGADHRRDGTSDEFHADPAEPGGWGDTAHRIRSVRGGFVDEPEFDLTGLGVDADWLTAQDRLVRWSVHTVRAALADAGLGLDDPVLARTGLVLGNYAFPTEQSIRMCAPMVRSAVTEGLRRAGVDLDGVDLDGDPAAPPVAEENLRTSGMPAVAVRRAFGLGGPAFTLDAACASALYGIAFAGEYLRSGRADVMLAGAVCAPDPLLIHLSFSDLGAVPDNGISQPFDARSGGITTGAGAGVFVLKRLSSAHRDGDHVHAVLESVGLSNDGTGRHLLAPNMTGQVDAYRDAYRRTAAAVDYVECHATGTPLGDSTELRGLAEFFGPDVPLLGSVKGNVGHLLTAAGVAGVLKVVLAMRHGVLPATPGIEELIGAEHADRIVRFTRPWPDADRRRAAVSTFGFGGTNAHAVLTLPAEDEPAAEPPPPTPVRTAVTGLGVRVGRVSGAAGLAAVFDTGRPVLADPPEDRWYGLDEVLPQQAGPAAYVDEIPVDLRRYPIPPAELTHANAQHLVLFEAVEQALADAGLAGPRRGPARRVAVLVVMETEPHTHHHRLRFDIGAHLRAHLDRAGTQLPPDEVDRLDTAARQGIHADLGANEVLSYIGNIMASRVSAAHNFTGPSCTLSGDATVGVEAVELAGLLLADPELDAVLVAGVELAAGPENTLARDRLARRLDTEPVALADAAAAVVLRRAGDSVADRCYAEVVATSVAHGDPADLAWLAGSGTGALHRAGLSPSDVDHVELGAPSTSGARREFEALAASLRPDESDARTATVGQTASATGDAQSCAGLLGVVKIAHCLRHAQVPAVPEPLDLSGVVEQGWHAPATAEPWRATTGRARTALACTVDERDPDHWAAAHLVLTGPSRDGHRPSTPDWRDGGGPLVLPFSAGDPAGLAAEAARLHAELAGAGDAEALAVALAVAAEPARTGRRTAVVVADTVAGLLDELDRASWQLPDALDAGRDWATPGGGFCAAEPIGPDGRIALVFPGAFTAYPGAGRGLSALFPDLFDRLAEHSGPGGERTHAALYPRSLRRLTKPELMRHEAALLDDVPTMLAVGTDHAILATDVFRTGLGLPVHGAFGYSLGESSMLFATGVWDPKARDDAGLRSSPLFRAELCGDRRLVRQRWSLPADLPADRVWATHVLLCPAEQARAAVAEVPRVFLTHVNSPGEVVVAGDPEGCDEVIRRLDCLHTRAPASHVMHCAEVRPLHAELAALNDYPLIDTDPGLDLFSAYDYETVRSPERRELAERIADTLCGEVDFPRLVTSAYDAGFRYFVEVGPGATCTRWITDSLADRPHVAATMDRRGQPTGTALARMLARLIGHGLPVSLGPLYGAARDRAESGPAVRQIVRCGGPSIVERVRAGVEEGRRVTEPPLPAAPAVAEPVADAIEFTELPAPVDRPVPIDAAGPSAAGAAPTGTATEVVSRTALVPLRSFVARPQPAPVPQGALPALVAATQLAHRSALRAQHALLLGVLERQERSVTGGQPPAVTAGGGGAGPVWDEAQLLEFATGRIEAVFGPRFAEIDTFSCRVRLPAPPYLFVTRVTELDAEPGQFRPSAITTEYDVPADPWYALDGVVPAAVTVEAGQCDLLLISYLGIDFRARGQRAYRLLDSTLIFHAGLPRVGQTLRYEITIDRFVWNGDTLLFFFGYDCYADGELILQLRDACAGFFTGTELADSLGVVDTAADRRRREGLRPDTFKPLERTKVTALTGDQLGLLTEGRLAEVFGPAWDQTADGCNPSIRLPGGRLLMLDEVTTIDRSGGPARLGTLRAVRHLEPDGWYFACHFPDDPVLAGSLVAQGGVQLLQVYAMHLGLHLVLPDAEFQAVPGLRTSVRVRGQIVPGTREIRYEAEVTRITMLPRPTIIADLTVYDGDKPIVRIQDAGIQVKEKPGTPYRPGPGAVAPFFGRRNHRGDPVYLTELHIAHAAKGDLAVTMGPAFEIYAGRRAPYLPNGAFRFIDRVRACDGTQGDIRTGETMDSEYDVPADVWYLADSATGLVPNCVYLETTLQSAILLGYSLGATLRHPDEEFRIRNLDGRAEVLREVDPRSRTFEQHSELLASYGIPGAVLQKFRYTLSLDGEPCYVGESLFGYFTDEALSRQVGLDRGEHRPTWLDTADLPEDAVRTVEPATRQPPTPPSLRYPQGRLRLVDELELVAEGGEHGLGYLRGRRRIDPADWYFDCHFHRDPVMPGSLGVEAVIEALHHYIGWQGLADEFTRPVFVQPVRIPMEWSYRGQFPRSDAGLTFELHVTEVRREDGRVTVIGDASLWNGPLRIYWLSGVAAAVAEDPTERGGDS
jgi:PfaB family protein